MTVEDALKIDQNWTPIQARNDLERLLLTDERPANKVIAMGVKALEKQMPKEIHISPYIYTRCNCGYEFSKHYGDGYYGVPEEKKTHFCPNCGQALKWEDTE